MFLAPHFRSLSLAAGSLALAEAAGEPSHFTQQFSSPSGEEITLRPCLNAAVRSLRPESKEERVVCLFIVGFQETWKLKEVNTV